MPKVDGLVQSWPVKFQIIIQRPAVAYFKVGVRSTTVSMLQFMHAYIR